MIVEVLAFANGNIACLDEAGAQVASEQETPLRLVLRDKLARGVVSPDASLRLAWSGVPTTVGAYVDGGSPASGGWTPAQRGAYELQQQVLHLLRERLGWQVDGTPGRALLLSLRDEQGEIRRTVRIPSEWTELEPASALIVLRLLVDAVEASAVALRPEEGPEIRGPGADAPGGPRP